jgi:hypothetical protein
MIDPGFMASIFGKKDTKGAAVILHDILKPKKAAPTPTDPFLESMKSID